MMISDRRIIFVGGAPRSGTTLLKNILDSHPEICSGPELDLLPAVAQLWEIAAEKVERERISAYFDQEQLRQRVADFIHSLLEPYRVSRGKPHIAEKTPNNILVFPQLAQIMPDAYLIHVIRDGRDVVSSMLEVSARYQQQGRRAPAFVQRAAAAAERWRDCVMAPTADPTFYESDRFKPRYYEVRYEELIHATETTLRGLCAHLNIEFSAEMLAPHLYPHEAPAGKADNLWWTDKMERVPIHNSSIGRWRRDLTVAKRLVIARRCQSELQRLGYVQDRSWIWANAASNVRTKGLDTSTFRFLFKESVSGRLSSRGI